MSISYSSFFAAPHTPETLGSLPRPEPAAHAQHRQVFYAVLEALTIVDPLRFGPHQAIQYRPVASRITTALLTGSGITASVLLPILEPYGAISRLGRLLGYLRLDPALEKVSPPPQ